jgi:hypothetical protein
MTTELITSSEYNDIAYEFANTLIGDGRAILRDRDETLGKKEPFHIITANCNGRILKVIRTKNVYPNWFLDPTKIKETGKSSTSYYAFKKAVYKVLEEKVGLDHKIFVKFIIVNKADKIYSIQFLHNNSKTETPVIDNSWISHSTGSSDQGFIQHNSMPSKTNKVHNTKKNKLV